MSVVSHRFRGKIIAFKVAEINALFNSQLRNQR